MRTLPPLLSIIAALSILILFVYFIPDTEARRGGGGKSVSKSGDGGGKSVSRSGNASGGSFNGSKSYRNDSKGKNRSNRGRNDNRGNSGKNVRSDRKDFKKDVRKDRRRHRVRRRVIGSILTIATYNALTCHRTVIIHVGVSYYGCGTVWYHQVYSGPNVTYVIVAAPPGY